jgi:beta-lactam-binding protein with PASTA domain
VDKRRYGDRYQVSRPLGSGGMAEVYLARDEQLGRNIALKVMHPEYAKDRAFIERFRREAQAAARLSDPKVVSIFDWGSDNGTYYIVMEYVEGKTLKEMLHERGPLPPERALAIAADVCDALHLAHEEGIVHRDIKPANIIKSATHTKVTDFGIARAATDTGQTVTQTGTVIGTASYLSPEQAQGLPVDARSDLYSVAIVLYEMLTGEVPFQGDTPVAIAYKHVTEHPRPPSALNPSLSDDVDAVVMKGLAKNPENRYQSAEEMAGDLRRILRGEPVTATPVLGDQDTMVSQRTGAIAGVPVDDRTRAMTPMPPPKGRRGLVYALTILLFLGILIAVVALVFSLLSNSAATVEVPNVVGETFADAEKALVDAGFKASRGGTEPSAEITEGHVTRQEPAGGRKVQKGQNITLIVSSGPPSGEVPDLTGMTEDEAESTLEASGLQKGEVKREASDTVEEGRIISTDPPKGEEVREGTKVNLLISAGKAKVKVPNVKGRSEDSARNLLEGAGLVAKVKNVCDVSQDDDEVLDQNPAANTEVGEGSEVEISVNDVRRVPTVLTRTEAQARSELEAAGFAVEVTQKNDVPGPNDRVTSQDPDVGTTACRGSTVRIEVEK